MEKKSINIFVFGSLNIDHTYHLPHMLRIGETLSSHEYSRNVGGKGLNQAIALSRAGSNVYFAGAIGADGIFLTDYLRENGIDTTCITQVDAPTGHAVIQVDDMGRNAILLFGGANQKISDRIISETLEKAQPGDWILLQNEINDGDRIIRAAYKRKMIIALNPSPFSAKLLTWPLEMVSYLILNEVEGRDLTGKTSAEDILNELLTRYPACHVVLTLGEHGSEYADAKQRYLQAAYQCDAVDTTAAGDTFTGYFLHAISCGQSIQDALKLSSRASSIAVTKPGAAVSIPSIDDVMNAGI